MIDTLTNPKLRDDLPRYPALPQLLRVTSGRVSGPSGVSQQANSSFLAGRLYVAFTEQLRTDTLMPVDREPCLVLDVNGLGLNPGFYIGRLAGSWTSLPVYEVALGVGPSASSGAGQSGGGQSQVGTIEVRQADGTHDITGVQTLILDQSTGLAWENNGIIAGNVYYMVQLLAASLVQMGAVTTTTQKFNGAKEFAGSYLWFNPSESGGAGIPGGQQVFQRFNTTSIINDVQTYPVTGANAPWVAAQATVANFSGPTITIAGYGGDNAQVGTFNVGAHGSAGLDSAAYARCDLLNTGVMAGQPRYACGGTDGATGTGGGGDTFTGGLCTTLGTPTSVPTGVAKFKKYTINANSFNSASTSQTITLDILPAQSVVSTVGFITDTGWAASGLLTLQFAVGYSGGAGGTSSNNAYMVSSPVMNQTVPAKAVLSDSNTGYYGAADNMSASYNLTLTATSTGANLNTFTAGSTRVWVLINQLP